MYIRAKQGENTDWIFLKFLLGARLSHVNAYIQRYLNTGAMYPRSSMHACMQLAILRLDYATCLSTSGSTVQPGCVLRTTKHGLNK